MGAKWKNKYKKIRKKFKYDLEIACGFDKTLSFAILKTYMACRHREHIYKIWDLMTKEKEFKLFKNAYIEKLSGEMLCGEDEILHTLYFVNNGLYKKYKGKITNDLAMGTAYGVALKMMAIERHNQD